jgi:hypothetical protein
MPGFFQRLMPRDGSSSSCSRNITENIVAGAQAFTKMLSTTAGVPEQVQQIFRKLNHFAPFYGPPPPFGNSLPLSLLEPPSPRP